MAAFPDAKVILTVRDPETWYESVKNSIYKTYGAHTYFPMNLFAWLMGIYKSLTISNRLSMEPARGAKKGIFYTIVSGLRIKPSLRVRNLGYFFPVLDWIRKIVISCLYHDIM